MKTHDLAVACIALLLCLALAACSGGAGSEAGLVGAYEAPAHGDEPRVQLILGERGEGEWKVAGEASPFTWEVREGELWLHTQTGGVLAGEITDRGVNLTLPGVGRLGFAKKAR